MPVNLTPAHLRCSLGGCSSVHEMEDGRLRIIGKIDPSLTVNEDGSPIDPEKWDGIGQDETAIIISPDLLANLPEILHLRSRVATLKQALEPMHQYAAELMMAHEAIMAAWRDKASPEIIIQIETLREKLFAVSKVARAALTE